MAPIIKEIAKLRKQLAEVCQMYRWALEAENHQIEERDKVLSQDDIEATALQRKESLVHLKRVKRQIQIALAEAQAEARIKRDKEASAEKVA